MYNWIEMKKKVKEMESKRREAERGSRRGMPGYGSSSMGGIGNRSYDSSASVVPVIADTIPIDQPSKFSMSQANSNRNISGVNKAMKLGSKRGNVDSFVDQLKNEGEGKEAIPCPMPGMVDILLY